MSCAKPYGIADQRQAPGTRLDSNVRETIYEIGDNSVISKNSSSAKLSSSAAVEEKAGNGAACREGKARAFPQATLHAPRNLLL